MELNEEANEGSGVSEVSEGCLHDMVLEEGEVLCSDVDGDDDDDDAVDVIREDNCRCISMDDFKSRSIQQQLRMLTAFMKVASPEVKFHLQDLIEDITMY